MSATTVVRIATRASRQATTQAGLVAAQLQAHGAHTELIFIDTYGDQTQAAGVPLHSIGGQGVFVKAVQGAVLDGTADIAVHSAKDLPTAPVAGLTIGAYCERRSPADALIGRSLDDLAIGATIATGSVRRRAQLHTARPDLEFVELRGNIDTRVQKVPEGGSVVVARAALELLEMTDLIVDNLDPWTFVPAVGQGCVAVECRTDAPDIVALLKSIDHEPTHLAVEVERAFLGELGTGCSAPVGAYSDTDELVTYLADERAATPIINRVALGDDHVDNMAAAATLARDGLAELGSRHDDSVGGAET